jgi:hypothetical protein
MAAFEPQAEYRPRRKPCSAVRGNQHSQPDAAGAVTAAAAHLEAVDPADQGAEGNNRRRGT